MFVLDDMEYPTDAAAKAAWVSTLGTDLASGGTASANLESKPASNAFDNINTTFWQKNGGPTGWLKYDLGEGNAVPCDGYSVYYNGNGQLSIKSWQFQGSNDNLNWDTLDTQINHPIWTSGVKEFFWFGQSSSYRYYRVNITQVNNANTLIYEFEILRQDMVVSVDSSIFHEGSKSLKIVSPQTTSLNKTVTRTLSPTFNLTGQTDFKFNVRSNRTGSNFKIGLHDSGGTTTEVTPNIASADTWQEVTLDLSAVSDANKDAIDSIIYTQLNADAETTVYMDYMRTLSEDEGTGGGISRARIVNGV